MEVLKADQERNKTNQTLLKSSCIVQGIIKCSAAEYRHFILLEHGLHLDLQVPVVFPKFTGLLCDPFLHSLVFGFSRWVLAFSAVPDLLRSLCHSLYRSRCAAFYGLVHRICHCLFAAANSFSWRSPCSFNCFAVA